MTATTETPTAGQNPRCNPGRNILTVKPYAGMAAQRPVAEPVKLVVSPEAFERLAQYAINSLADDEQDIATDMVAALAPHMPAEVATDYWGDLKEAVIKHGQAQDGEYPGDVDPLRWAEQCRAAVDFAAEKLAGV